MLLKYIYDEKLAQASYFLGCQQTGEALVVDPARDIRPYLQAAHETGLRIAHVAETHIHADYISGGRELAAATGAALYLSGHGQGELGYDYSRVIGIRVVELRDNDLIMVGNVKVRALHTPGHTPEHLAYLVTDSGADHPIGLFSGDCLFVGDVGRPDLLDATGMAAGSAKAGAHQQFESVQRLKTLADYLQVWPGHGAGSACGKTLGALPGTTIGYERLFNPAFQHTHAEPFAAWLLADQPAAPRYFAQMKRVNRVGPALLDSLGEPPRLSAQQFYTVIARGDAFVIDARPQREFAARCLPGTVNIPGVSNSFSTYVGWLVDYTGPTYLIAHESELQRLVAELRAIGVDRLAGCITPDALEFNGTSINQIDVYQARQALEDARFVFLDVRNADERQRQFIAGSRFIPIGQIHDRLNELPRDATIVVHCASGLRSQMVASILQNYGFRVKNLEGGLEAWERARLPLETATRSPAQS